MGQILTADNDVFVGIFVTLQDMNSKHFQIAVGQLSLMYAEIWKPQEVEKEFINHPFVRDKRIKTLEKIFWKYQFVKRCPVTVSRIEIDLDNNYSSDDWGETDAMLQSAKASAKPDSRLQFSGIHLLFRDRRAIAIAESKNLQVLHYKALANKLRGIGVILPN